MRKRFGFIPLTGALVALVALAIVGTVSAMEAGASARHPVAVKIDPLLISRTAACLRRALAAERAALKVRKERIHEDVKTPKKKINRLLRSALEELSCARRELAGRAGELPEGDGRTVNEAIDDAVTYDNKAITKEELEEARREIVKANNAKILALATLTGDAPPPEEDLGYEAAAADSRVAGEKAVVVNARRTSARVMSGRSSPARVPVNAIELSARKPITRFSDWTVGGPSGIRTGKCTRLAASLVTCRIDPPMPPDHFFVISLAGLGSGTAVVVEIVSGNRAQHIRLRTS